MDELDEKRIRSIVRSELIGIIDDAKEKLGAMKDPTGIGRKVLDGMASLIKQRNAADSSSD